MLPFKNLSLPPHSAPQRVKTGTHNGKEQMDIIVKLHYLRKGGDHQTGHDELSPQKCEDVYSTQTPRTPATGETCHHVRHGHLSGHQKDCFCVFTLYYKMNTHWVEHCKELIRKY